MHPLLRNTHTYIHIHHFSLGKTHNTVPGTTMCIVQIADNND